MDPNTVVPIHVTWNDAKHLWHTAQAAEMFRDQFGRFETVDVDGADSTESTSLGDRLLAAPVFNDGYLLWCESYLEALAVTQLHRAHGHTAHLLNDTAENPDGTFGSWCVLTSHNIVEDA